VGGPNRSWLSTSTHLGNSFFFIFFSCPIGTVGGFFIKAVTALESTRFLLNKQSLFNRAQSLWTGTTFSPATGPFKRLSLARRRKNTFYILSSSRK
jgi:hypothetical protein